MLTIDEYRFIIWALSHPEAWSKPANLNQGESIITPLYEIKIK